MKTEKSTISLFVLFAFLISYPLFAQQVRDTSLLRYVKFSTSVNANNTRIALQEIKAFSNGQNIAVGKTINVSNSSYDIYIDKIIDDNKASEWESDDYTSLTNDIGVGPTYDFPHFIVVDLGSKYNLESLVLNLADFDYTFDFKVSEDSINWALVDSKTNTRGVYTYTSIPIQNVRYIKYICYSSSDWGQVNVQEIQAFVGGVNVALNKNAKANSYEGNNPNRAKDAVDGNAWSRWSSNRWDHQAGNRPLSAPVNATIDLGSIQVVDSLELEYHTNTLFTIAVSTNGIDWLQIDQRLNSANNYRYVLRPVGVVSTIESIDTVSVIYKSVITAKQSADVLSSGLCWSTSPNPTITDSHADHVAAIGSFFTTLSSLVPNTMYYVRAYANTINGTVYSQESNFIFGVVIHTDVVSNPTLSTATSGGFVVAKNGIEVTERGVCWSTSAMPTITNDRTYDGSGSGDFTSSLYGLNGTTVYVRSYATTNQGTAYGEQFQYHYSSLQYLANDGYFSGEVFTESGTTNGLLNFSGNYGDYIYYNGSNWVISDWISSYDNGNPPLNGWEDATYLTLINLPSATVSVDKSSLKESSFNDGSFKESIAFTHNHLNDAVFAGNNQEDFVATGKAIVRNLPNGLTAKIIRNSDLSLTLTLSGKAVANGTANNLTNVKVMLLPEAFSDGNTKVSHGNMTLLSLNFIDPVNISVTGTKTNADYTITTDNNVTLENSSYFTVNDSTTLNQLIVNPGASIVVNKPLVVNDVILKADDSNSFSAKIESGVTVNGDVIFQKSLIDGKTYYLSFPCSVDVQNISMLGGGTLNDDWMIYSYDSDKRSKTGSHANWNAVTSGSLIAGKGYAFALKAGIGTKMLQFVLNKSIACVESNKSVSTEYFEGNVGDHHKGWNLIGQPYLRHFEGGNMGINYLIRWDGDRYNGLLSSKVSALAPFEAFFVQVPSANSISFNATPRQTAPSRVISVADETIQLNMSAASGKDSTTMLINSNYSSTYTIGEDLEKWINTSSEKPQLYSTLNGVLYTYNALQIGDVVTLPIGCFSQSGGASTISASNVSVTDLTHLMLIDTELNISTDLLSSSYSFDAAAGTNNSRFVLTAQRLATDMNSSNNSKSPFVYSSHSKIYIKNIPLHSTYKVCDLYGRVLVESHDATSSDEVVTVRSSGVHVVQIITDSAVWSWKVW